MDVLVDKKGEDIILLDLIGVASFTDYFVICSGSSHRMIRALANAVQDELRETYKLKTRVEGEPEGGWLLGDYGDVVVHIFSEEQRKFYALEELWAGGKVLLHMQ